MRALCILLAVCGAARAVTCRAVTADEAFSYADVVVTAKVEGWNWRRGWLLLSPRTNWKASVPPAPFLVRVNTGPLGFVGDFERNRQYVFYLVWRGTLGTGSGRMLTIGLCPLRLIEPGQVAEEEHWLRSR